MIHSKMGIRNKITSAVTNDDNKEEKRRTQIPPLGLRLALCLGMVAQVSPGFVIHREARVGDTQRVVLRARWLHRVWPDYDARKPKFAPGLLLPQFDTSSVPVPLGLAFIRTFSFCIPSPLKFVSRKIIRN